MTALARLSTVLATVLLPALSLAQYGQEAGGNDPAASGAGYAWLWAVAAAAILAALFATVFWRRRRGGPTPPARTP